MGSKDDVHQPLARGWSPVEAKGKTQFCQLPLAVKSLLMGLWGQGHLPVALGEFQHGYKMGLP